MRVAITGGRDFDDMECVDRTLSSLHEIRRITELAHGKACGADSLAGVWAMHRGVTVRTYEADWKKHGKAAGPIRNEFMLSDFDPYALVVFPGGRGTADCVRRAVKMGVTIIKAVPSSEVR